MLAHSVTSAPPAFSVIARLAVSLVTCRQRADAQSLERSLARESLADDAQHRHLARRPFDQALPVAGHAEVGDIGLGGFQHVGHSTPPFVFMRSSAVYGRPPSAADPPSAVNSIRNANPAMSPPSRSHQRRRRARGAAGGEQVVDDEHALTGLDRVRVDLDDRLPVLEAVRLGDALRGQASLLADRSESGAEAVGDRPAEDEPAGFDARNRAPRGYPGTARPSPRWPPRTPAPSPRSRVMSLKMMPGRGKSGISRIRARSRSATSRS